LSDENENIAEQFLATHPDFKLLNAAEILAQQQIELDTGNYLKLLPHLHNTDGFFAAVFEKQGNASAAKSDDIKTEVTETVEMPEAAEEVAVATAAVKKTAKPKVAKPKAVKVKTAKS